MTKKEFLYYRIGWDYKSAESTWETYNWFLDYCDLDMIDLSGEDFENEIICNLTDIQQIIKDIISKYFENGSLFNDALVNNDFYEYIIDYYSSFITLYHPNIIQIDFSELFIQVIDFAGANNIEIPKVKDEGRILLNILDALNYKYPFKFTHP